MQNKKIRKRWPKRAIQTFMIGLAALSQQIQEANGQNVQLPACGESEWFQGLNASAESTFTVADFEPDTELFWLGGTTTKSHQFPVSIDEGYVTRSTAAIILTTRPGQVSLNSGYLVDHVTHPTDGDIAVTGVRTLIAFDEAAFGVFEADNLTTIFFHIDAPDGLSPSVKFKLFTQNPTGIFCDMKQEHLRREPDNTILYTGTACPHNGNAYAGKIYDTLSSGSKVFSANFMPDIAPFGISANDSQLLWGTYGIDSVSSEPTLYFMSLPNDSTMSAAAPICVVEYAHDSGKTSGSAFTPKVLAIDEGNQYNMVGEDTGGLGYVLVSILVYENNDDRCPDKISYIMFGNSNVNLTYRSFRTETLIDDGDNSIQVQHLLMHDSIADLHILQQSMRVQEKKTGEEYTVTMTKSVSSFSLDTSIFRVFVGSPGAAPHQIRAVGTPGYFFTDGFDARNSCLQMTLESSDEKYKQKDGNTKDGISVLSSAGQDNALVTFLDVYSGDFTQIRLSKLDDNDFALQNPCGITVFATLPDISRDFGDPASISKDLTATASGTCPAATYQFSDYQLIVVDLIDSNGNSVANPENYITVDHYDSKALLSEVNDVALEGSYTVHYVVGLAQESLSELLSHTPQTLSLDLGIPVQPVCTSVLVPDFLEIEYVYLLGSSTLEIPLVASTGSCSYTVSISTSILANMSIQMFAGTFSNPDPSNVHIFTTLTHPYAEVYTVDAAQVNQLHTLIFLYEDSAGTQVTLSTTLSIEDPCTTTGLLGVPLNDGSRDQLYVIDTPTQTVDLSHITNGDCNFIVSAAFSVSPSVPLSTFGLELFEPVLQSDSTNLHYTVLSNGYIEIQSGDETLDGATYAFQVTVESDIDAADTVQQTFTFTVTYQVIPCSPDLTASPLTVQSQYLYEIGSGPLSITMDGIHNGSCFFAVSLYNVDDWSDVSTTPPFTLTQPSLAISDPYLPNDYSIVADSVLTIEESNELNELVVMYRIRARQDLSVPWLASDPFYDFEVQIFKPNDCTPGFRNVPANDIMYFYVLQKPALTIEFSGLDNTECFYELSISDTTYGTAFSHSAFQLNLATFVQLTAESNILTTASFPSIAVESQSTTIDGIYTILVRMVQDTNILSQAQVDFTVQVTILPPCTVTFPAENTAELTLLYQVNVDEEIVVTVESEEIDYQDYCEEHTHFTIEMADDPLLEIDSTMFTFDEVLRQLTISSTDRTKIGLYQFLITERSDIAASVDIFTTQLDVTVTDFCLGATLAVDTEIIELQYTAGDESLIINLEEIENSFQVDDEHSSECQPIVFAYTGVQSQGTISLDSTLQISQSSKQATVSSNSQQGQAQILLVTEGTILGVTDYAKAQVITVINVLEVSVETVLTVEAEEPGEIPGPVVQVVQQEVVEVKIQVNTAYIAFQEAYQPKVRREGTAPSIQILSMSQTGTMTLYVDIPLKIPPWPQIEGLTIQEVIEQFPIGDYLDFQIESDHFDDGAKEIGIKSSILKKFTQQFIVIEFTFQSPNSISLDATSKDLLEIRVKDNSIFSSANFGVRIPLDTTLSEALQPQLTVQQQEEAAQFEGQLTGALVSSSWTSIILQFFLAYGLKYLWGIVNIMQFAVFLPVWSVNYPAKVLAFLKAIKVIAFMEFLPTSWLTDGISDAFGMNKCDGSQESDCTEIAKQAVKLDEEKSSEEESLRRRLERLLENDIEQDEGENDDDLDDEDMDDDEEPKSIKGPNLIKQLGAFFGLFCLILLLIGILACFRICAMTKYSVYRCYMTIKTKIFWNTLIRFSLQSFLKLMMGACITLSLLTWANIGDIQQGIISIVMIVALSFLPFLYVFVMWRKFDNLWMPSVRDRIGTIYNNMNPEKVSALAYTMVFLGRRSLFVILTFTLTLYPHLQIQIFTYSTLLFMCYFNADLLHVSRSLRNLETVNEYFFLLLCYHIVLFNNMVGDFETRESIGKSFIFTSIFLVVINVTIIFVASCVGIKEKCRHKMLEKKQQKLIAEHLQDQSKRKQMLQEYTKGLQEAKFKEYATAQQILHPDNPLSQDLVVSGQQTEQPYERQLKINLNCIKEMSYKPYEFHEVYENNDLVKKLLDTAPAQQLVHNLGLSEIVSEAEDYESSVRLSLVSSMDLGVDLDSPSGEVKKQVKPKKKKSKKPKKKKKQSPNNIHTILDHIPTVIDQPTDEEVSATTTQPTEYQFQRKRLPIKDFSPDAMTMPAADQKLPIVLQPFSDSLTNEPPRKQVGLTSHYLSYGEKTVQHPSESPFRFGADVGCKPRMPESAVRGSEPSSYLTQNGGVQYMVQQEFEFITPQKRKQQQSLSDL